MVPTVVLRRTGRLGLPLAVSIVAFIGCFSGDTSILVAQDLPPIECPLRKAGIDKTKLQPFEEVEKYVKFLERPDRAQWQKPDVAVPRVLGVRETLTSVGVRQPELVQLTGNENILLTKVRRPQIVEGTIGRKPHTALLPATVSPRGEGPRRRWPAASVPRSGAPLFR